MNNQEGVLQIAIKPVMQEYDIHIILITTSFPECYSSIHFMFTKTNTKLTLELLRCLCYLL